MADTKVNGFTIDFVNQNLDKWAKLGSSETLRVVLRLVRDELANRTNIINVESVSKINAIAEGDPDPFTQAAAYRTLAAVGVYAPGLLSEDIKCKPQAVVVEGHFGQKRPRVAALN